MTWSRGCDLQSKYLFDIKESVGSHVEDKERMRSF